MKPAFVYVTHASCAICGVFKTSPAVPKMQQNPAIDCEGELAYFTKYDRCVCKNCIRMIKAISNKKEVNDTNSH